MFWYHHYDYELAYVFGFILLVLSLDVSMVICVYGYLSFCYPSVICKFSLWISLKCLEVRKDFILEVRKDFIIGLHQICIILFSSLRIYRRYANTSHLTFSYSCFLPHFQANPIMNPIHPCLHPFHPVFIALVMAPNLVLEEFGLCSIRSFK
jgi:hypothetical protein